MILGIGTHSVDGRPTDNPAANALRNASLAQHRFSDVVSPENATPLNLQMFHRGGDGLSRCLPDGLEWPLPELFRAARDAPQSSADPHAPTPAPARAVTVDKATRVSQRGALTWWHLDDGGEFVLQVGLPIRQSRLRDPKTWSDPGAPSDPVPPHAHAPGSSKPIVKVFVFADKASYKYIMQDGEANKTGRAACLDLFGTPTAFLPPPEVLPPLIVAPLAAGGRPLLSPPNAPHLVLTVQDCVMVEERRISTLFL